MMTRSRSACQAGEARACAAARRRRAARPHTAAAGQPEAMAILMRRTLMRTSAPIFNSLSRTLALGVSCLPLVPRPIHDVFRISNPIRAACPFAAGARCCRPG